MQIRPIALPDTNALVELSAQLGYAIELTTVRHNLQRMLGNADHCLLVAENPAGEVVGWVHGFVRPLIESPLSVEIGGLVVDQRCRRQGIGAALMAAVERWTQAQGIAIVSLRSAAQREEAHAFYRGLGYAEVKRQLAFRKTLA
ncbi:GNAT family N-acetyltransferase [Chitinimonas sp. BJYL2]|uniref:GNAT family N-acetyltransferase n=1 Tax=Chitinimonas sp. BJYL2 TaxID=2976696 RepID=UPI0022B4E2D6|nr:GNAT family N-acetyltransferase [Chitinimonas sp. BJYL2]